MDRSDRPSTNPNRHRHAGKRKDDSNLSAPSCRGRSDCGSTTTSRPSTPAKQSRSEENSTSSVRCSHKDKSSGSPARQTMCRLRKEQPGFEDFGPAHLRLAANPEKM